MRARLSLGHDGFMTQVEWTLHPDAQALVDGVVDAAISRSPATAAFAQRLLHETSTRLQDWLDSVVAPVDAADLRATGYVDGYLTEPGVWRHPGAQLPAVVIGEDLALNLRVDDVAACAQALRSAWPLEGSPLSEFRRVAVIRDNGVEVAGVERRSWSAGVTAREFTGAEVAAAARAWRELAERPRALEGAEGVIAQLPAASRAVSLVGADLAASYFLELERAYWQRSQHRRNRAARSAGSSRPGVG